MLLDLQKQLNETKMDNWIFDLDGTLVNLRTYEEIYPLVIDTVLALKKIDIHTLDELALASKVYKNSRQRWDTGDLCREFGLLEIYYSILEGFIRENNILTNNALEILNLLKERGARIGIASNSMKRTIETYLEMYSLGSKIDFICSAVETGVSKNKVGFWEHLIRRFDINPMKSTVIGDNPLDDFEVPKSVGFNALLTKQNSLSDVYLRLLL